MHFTYTDTIDSNSLKQGDILEKTPDICALLKEVHPHYLKDDYTHFQVLTQSCDLVRRGESCSAKYISLAAVRPLELALNRELNKKAKPIVIDEEPYINENKLTAITNFLDALFNNNNKDYFFLREEPSAGLAIDSCTFLHLSIAIKPTEHYDKCLGAKIIELSSNFRAKLGWLVGNIYSRVGTPDWVPTQFSTSKEFQSLLKNTVTGYTGLIPHNIFTEFKAAAKENNYKNAEHIIEIATAKRQKKAEDQAKRATDAIHRKLNLTKKQQETLIIALQSDSVLRKAIKLD